MTPTTHLTNGVAKWLLPRTYNLKVKDSLSGVSSNLRTKLQPMAEDV